MYNNRTKLISTTNIVTAFIKCNYFYNKTTKNIVEEVLAIKKTPEIQVVTFFVRWCYSQIIESSVTAIP